MAETAALSPPKPRTPPAILFKMLSAGHVWLYRVSGGRLGGTMKGAPVSLLTVKGRKTGRTLTRPVIAIPAEPGYALIASKAGGPSHPAWYRNLLAAGHAELETAGRTERLRVEEIAPDDPRYAVLWAKGVALYPDYDAYRTRTTRQIPILLLLPEG